MYAGSNWFSSWLTNIIAAYSRLPHSSPFISARSRAALNARDFPAQLQALAILLPKRTYATETSTQGSENGPPPGFNINEAKKPIQKGDGKQASAPTIEDMKKSSEETSIAQNTATAVEKNGADASLSDLAAQKAEEEAKKEGKAIAAKKEENKKLTIGQKIKKELHHYWDGTKLLATEVRISSKLALKMAAGYELSRRENRQVRFTFSRHPMPILTLYSFSGPSKILDASFLSRLLLLFPSPNFCFLSPSSSSPTSFPLPSKARNPVKTRPLASEIPANMSRPSSARLFARPVYP